MLFFIQDSDTSDPISRSPEAGDFALFSVPFCTLSEMTKRREADGRSTCRRTQYSVRPSGCFPCDFVAHCSHSNTLSVSGKTKPSFLSMETAGTKTLVCASSPFDLDGFYLEEATILPVSPLTVFNGAWSRRMCRCVCFFLSRTTFPLFLRDNLFNNCITCALAANLGSMHMWDNYNFPDFLPVQQWNDVVQLPCNFSATKDAKTPKFLSVRQLSRQVVDGSCLESRPRPISFPRRFTLN